MSEKKTGIAIGDRVDVLWDNTGYLFDVVVVYIPTVQGDAWIFRDNDDRLHYVQNYARISERHKP